MPRLSPEERGRALGLLEAGVPVSRVARMFNVTRATLYSLQDRFHATGTGRDRQRTGRPRVTTRAEDRFIRLQHLRNRFQPAAVTARNFQARNISRHTVRRRLAEDTIRARRPARRPRLLPRHIRARLLWAQAHLRWPRHQWANVIFSDESRFVIDRHDGRLRCYRHVNERFLPQCILEATNRGYGEVMVWGGITRDHRTDLVLVPRNMNAAVYIAHILQPHLVPFLQGFGPGVIFQHDNAPPHRARLTQQYLLGQNIDVLQPWPAVSPDLNPIEHAWDILGRRVRARNPPPQNAQELFQALTREWNNLPQRQISNLVNSMRRRCAAVINARGGYTRY